MTSDEISKIRLQSQKVSETEFKSPGKIVSWMGAMQAQDYLMSKWAIGVRLSDQSEEKVESAIDKGEIIRIHVLRPTWHFISADDIYWMLDLSAPKIKSSLKTRHKELELTETIIGKTKSILLKKLSNGNGLTRDEIAQEFARAKIRTDANRLSHILFRSEIDGIICSGPLKEKKTTYSLLNERVPHKKNLIHDEALAELAKRYFASRCPATMEDFMWWSNLSITDARKATGYIKSEFSLETTDTGTYLIPDTFSGELSGAGDVHLLPAYDEFLLSYRDRSCSLAVVDNKKTVSDNGIFYPLIVVDGQVEGIWKRSVQKNKVYIDLNFFKRPDKHIRHLLEEKLNLFGKFLDKEIVIRNTGEK
jgi:hypothetical protein